MKRVLFVFFNMNSPISYSFGVSYLSSALKKASFEVSHLHLNENYVSEPVVIEVLDKIERVKPDVLCCSAISTQQSVVIPVLRTVRDMCEDVLIVVGGLLATFDPDSLEGISDVIIRGEAEESLPHILKLEKKPRCRSSLSFKSSYSDLTHLPRMDMEAFDFEDIVKKKSGWVEMAISRGCSFRCSYCFNQEFVRLFGNSNYIRFKPVEKAMVELENFKDTCKSMEVVNFVDDNFTLNVDHLQAFLPEYSSRIGLPFLCATRPELINESVAGLLESHGCKVVRMGLESGSEELRHRELNRASEDDILLEAADVLKDAGIEIGLFNMIGIPGETEEDILKTLSLNATIAPSTSKRTVLLPFKGTEIYRKWQGCIDKKKLVEQVHYDNCKSVFRLGDEWLQMIEYYQENWGVELSKMSGIKYDYRWEDSVVAREDYVGVI